MADILMAPKAINTIGFDDVFSRWSGATHPRNPSLLDRIGSPGAFAFPFSTTRRFPERCNVSGITINRLAGGKIVEEHQDDIELLKHSQGVPIYPPFMESRYVFVDPRPSGRLEQLKVQEVHNHVFLIADELNAERTEFLRRQDQVLR